MKNTFGSDLSLTIFGESHGRAVGAVLDGMAAGVPVDESFLAACMDKRRARGDGLSTPRVEADAVQLLSGVVNGHTTGTAIALMIENQNTRSGDYAKTADLLRPGHADFTAYAKYHGFQDARGGGHFSGRITAALVAGLVTAFEASSILDVVFHGLLLWYLAMGVRRGREAMEEPEGQRETPEPLPQNTEFYDASMGERPNSPSLGQPAEGKHRTLLTAAYGSHEIEVRRSYGLTELIVDGRVYGRQEGVVETGYTIRARVSGHDVETEFTPTGKQLLRVDGQVIARKQRLF